MKEKPRILSAFGQSVGHVPLGLVESASSGKGPCERIMRKNVLPLLKFLLGQAHGQFSLFASRREIERKGSRVSPRSLLTQTQFYLRGLGLTPGGAQRFSQ